MSVSQLGRGGGARSAVVTSCVSVSPEVDALVVSVLSAAHVAVVADDFPQVLWRHLLLLSIHEAELALLGVPLALQLLPFAGLSEHMARGASFTSLNYFMCQYELNNRREAPTALDY